MIESYKSVIKSLFEIGAYSLGVFLILCVFCLIIAYIIGGILMYSDKKNGIK